MGTGITVAVEVGGTFTDVVVCLDGPDGQHMKTLKILSTPGEPERSVMEALRQVHTEFTELSEFLHGSTVATNAVIERKGAKTALLTTKGFRDILEIQRGDKTSVYKLCYRRPEPLVSRERCMTVNERISAKGEIIVPLDEKDVGDVVRRLANTGIESIAISFLNSFANQQHEELAARIVKELLPMVSVSVSSELLPQFREYERTSTTVINAYVSPIVDRYLGKLEGQLQSNGFEGPCLIMQSNGGIMTADAARKRAVWMLLSGPAAGVVAALAVARAAGHSNIITLDMGGTSTDVCLVSGGKPQISTEGKVGGLAIGIPGLEIVSVGAGGGSIAWKDEGGLLRVGPGSAGADPGPACYGRGGEQPTVTDAQVVRGIIRETQFIGGTLKLRHDYASKAIQSLGSRLKLDKHKTADAIVRISNNNMMQAIRVVSAEKGHDPRDYTLVAFGGAGPLHAAEIAKELGMKRVLIPRNAGLFSAMGLLMSDFKRDYSQTHIQSLSDLTSASVNSQFLELIDRAIREFHECGIVSDDIGFSYSLDMRYQGQAFEILVDLPSPSIDVYALRTRFEEEYMTRYGYVPVGLEVEIVNYRVTASSTRNTSPAILHNASGSAETGPDQGTIFCGGALTQCAFYRRSLLKEGDVVVGAAVVEEKNSACYIPEDWTATVDPIGTLVLERRN